MHGNGLELKKALGFGGAAFALGALVLAFAFAPNRAAAESPGIARSAQVIEGLKLPLQRYENGRVKTMLSADRAWMGEGGVSAEGNITLHLLADDGRTNGTAKAERGTFNQKDETALCTGPVFMEINGSTLTGTNMFWDAKLHLVRIETNAVLTIGGGVFK